MADGSYNILVGIEPDVTGLQQKLNAKTQNIKIKTSINMGQKDIDSYVKQWNNQISRMQFKSPDIFKNEEVQANLKVLQNNITNFSQRGGASVQDVRGSFDDLKTSVTKVGASMKNTTKDGYGFTSMLDVAIKKVAVWMIATQAVYGSLRKLEEGVQYIKDLNVELTNLQIVTGKTDEEIAQLARDYGYLAQQVGATTIEVAQGSLEWARQGKTAEEARANIREAIRGYIAVLEEDHFPAVSGTRPSNAHN
jgi:chromosome segregation ATPase